MNIDLFQRFSFVLLRWHKVHSHFKDLITGFAIREEGEKAHKSLVN